MKTSSFFAALLCFLSSVLPGHAASMLDIDYASFRGDSASSYVEIYASVQRDGLIYQHQGDSLQAAFKVILEIGLEGETMVADTFTGVDVTVHRDSLKSGQFFPHVYQYFMKPGDYDLRASLYQYEELTDDPYEEKISIRDFSEDSFDLSDIQLGCSLESTDQIQSMFVKNGYRILPNPTAFYGTQLPMFYFYTEVYGLSYDTTAIDSIGVFRAILRGDTDEPVRGEKQTIYKKTGSSAVIATGFPVYTLQTGSYKFRLRVLDYTNGELTEHVKRFFCYRPDDFAMGNMVELDQEMKTKLVNTNLQILEIIDPDSAVELMHYLFETKAEEEAVNSYSVDGKRAFLQEYWAEREQDEPDAANKYFARIAVANMRYGYFNKPGWRTDRGRVFIMYGEPDDVERNYGVADQNDHEIWSYDQLEGGVEFVFIDKTNFGVLELVHSTKKGEIKSPYWNSNSPSSIDVRDARGR